MNTGPQIVNSASKTGRYLGGTEVFILYNTSYLQQYCLSLFS